MLSFPLVTILPLARGCLYIWVTFSLPRIEMNYNKNWHDAFSLVGTQLDLHLEITLFVCDLFYLGNFTLIWISCIQEFVILSNWLVSSPLGILSLASQSLTRNSTLGVSSLRFYWVGESGQRGQPVYILCVCVCLRFVCHVHPLPRHKSRESVKIGPHPRGHPSSEYR
jgi:hypothetical protein